MPRLFTGVEIPADVGQALGMLRGGLPGARWIDPENYHLTLRFIGDVDDMVAQEVALMLGARQARRIRYLPGGADLVRRPQAARGGRVGGAGAGLARRAGRARTADAAHRLGAGGAQIHAARDAGALARFLEPAVAEYLSARGLFRTAAFRVSRFVLFSSRASVGGGPYVVEASYPLN